MNTSMTQEIQVEDYPDLDPATESGRDELSLIAYGMKQRSPWLTYFVFKRGDEIVGEMYIRGLFDEQEH